MSQSFFYTECQQQYCLVGNYEHLEPLLENMDAFLFCLQEGLTLYVKSMSCLHDFICALRKRVFSEIYIYTHTKFVYLHP